MSTTMSSSPSFSPRRYHRRLLNEKEKKAKYCRDVVSKRFFTLFFRPPLKRSSLKKFFSFFKLNVETQRFPSVIVIAPRLIRPTPPPVETSTPQKTPISSRFNDSFIHICHFYDVITAVVYSSPSDPSRPWSSINSSSGSRNYTTIVSVESFRDKFTSIYNVHMCILLLLL